MSFKKIAIFGVGLIGGSFALALGKDGKVWSWGISNNKSLVAQWLPRFSGWHILC